MGWSGVDYLCHGGLNTLSWNCFLLYGMCFIFVSLSLCLFFPFCPAEKPRMNNILTSQTEPYDLSFSRSFQNLTHLPPSYEMAVKVDLSTYSSLHYCGKDDEYYIRKHHLPDPTPRGGNLQTHMIKLNVDPPAQRQKPKRVQRAMSQDHVLSGGAGGLPPYHGRILSEEQLLSTDRLHSQDPLLSSDKMLSLRRSDFREKAMSRALSHTDMFMPTTPVMDRHCKMMKMHSHPSSSNNESYNTLTVNSAQVGNKRQAFASRRMHTVDHLQYIPGHHHHQYRTASKTEVTV
uniref:Shisa family member 6 n=1 Tax=Sinocyclocheilus rhinocerous TaxID=307959 RepID=A0A673JQV2_9TELE